MSIGQNIKNLRLQHGLSQRELAEIAGVTDKAVSTWELDKKAPRMGSIQRMADYFGIKKSDIIEDEMQVSATFGVQRIVSNNVLLNPEEAQLVYGYRELDTGKQQMLMNMLAFLHSPQASSSVIIQSNIGNNNSLKVGDNNSVTVGR